MSRELPPAKQRARSGASSKRAPATKLGGTARGFSWRRATALRSAATTSATALVLSLGICLTTVFTAYGAASPSPSGTEPAFISPAANTGNTTHKKPSAKQSTRAPQPKPPTPPEACPAGSMVNIVAHEDDDILFINPTIQEALDANMCVHTIYVTAGDSGFGASYWEGREHGADAAYSTMLRSETPWEYTALQTSNRMLTMHALPDRPQVALLFLHLPDGNMSGQGFAATDHESLHKLRGGDITDIHPIDGSTNYTAQQLVNTLSELLRIYQATTVNTQASTPRLAGGDHSDHQSVGYFAQQAVKAYNPSTNLHYYIGYQSGFMPANLDDAQTANKQAVFDAYEPHDGSICIDTGECFGETYQNYFSRQYQLPRTKP